MEDEKDVETENLFKEIVEQSLDNRKRLVSALDDLNDLETDVPDTMILLAEARAKIGDAMTKTTAQLVEMYKARKKSNPDKGLGELEGLQEDIGSGISQDPYLDPEQTENWES